MRPSSTRGIATPTKIDFYILLKRLNVWPIWRRHFWITTRKEELITDQILNRMDHELISHVAIHGYSQCMVWFFDAGQEDKNYQSQLHKLPAHACFVSDNPKRLINEVIAQVSHKSYTPSWASRRGRFSSTEG